MRTDIDKIYYSEKFGINFETTEVIKLIVKPNLKSAFLYEIKSLLSLFLFFAIVLVFTYFTANSYKSTYNKSHLFLFFGFITLINLYGLTKRILNLRKTVYLITNFSVVIHQDFNDTITKTLKIKDIKTKELTKTIFDKYINTGTIKIFMVETVMDDGAKVKVFDNIQSIVDPEKVYNLL